MPLYRDPKSANWFIDIKRPGQKRIRKSTGTADRKEAQKALDRLTGDLAKGKVRVNTKRWLDACTLWLKAEPRGESDRFRLGALAWHTTNPPLADFDTDMIERELTKEVMIRRGAGYRPLKRSPDTINRYCNLIHAVLALAASRGMLDHVPVMPKRKKPTGRIRWLTHQEWKALQAELPDHLLNMARFSIATGVRQHNATHLTWSQIDLKRNTAWVYPDEAKARKPLVIALSKEAAKAVKAQTKPRESYKPHANWVFPYHGGPVDKIKGAFVRACERAKIEGFTWHGLRHTWASWHIQNGTPVEVLKELGGWASITQVMVYAHLAPSHVAQYANNSKPVKARQSFMAEAA